MTKLALCALIFGLFVLASSAPNTTDNQERGILDCFFESESLTCAKNRADTQLDAIEQRITGRSDPVPFSRVFEDAGAILVDGTRSLLGETDESTTELDDEEEDKEEGRSSLRQPRKKFGKKKKKMLAKLLSFVMLIKAKIGLLLQLISTHFQLKFFALAILSLVVNVARFWIDIKKDHHPSKVVYYEHAQHQHHYDHEDDHGGYWGRSDLENPAQELAYNAHK
ncbi:uncharacterized protein [Venturia canescens]|uniref:uncharacterized protein n=1 Tax=Venturia canescens TaxID=32260 RepID=UPI001C9C2DD5|nr:uncharacterized protein LOC122413459 [Venturia canescens]